MRSKDEQALIQLARRRDPEAISELYRRHVDAIYRYTYFRVSDSAVAEDLTAEVFLRALESIENYTDTGLPFSAWLFKIAHARVIDHWRRQERHPQVALDESLPGEKQDGETLEIQERDAALGRAIRRLSPDQQQVITLRFYAGLSNAEIAAIMNKTAGAVKALQHRALASLARLLEQEP